MLKCLITAGSYTSGDVPITVYKNTNSNYSVANNAISIINSGITDVKMNLILTATSTNVITVQLYANGDEIPGAYAELTPVSGNNYTFNINDVVKTIPASTGYTELTFEISEPCTIVGGDVICEYVR